MQNRNIIDYITDSITWYNDKERYLNIFNHFVMPEHEILNKIAKYDAQGICNKYFREQMSFKEIAVLYGKNTEITIKKQCINAITQFVNEEIENIALTNKIEDIYIHDLCLPKRFKPLLFRKNSILSHDPTVKEILQISPETLQTSLPNFGEKSLAALYKYLENIGAELTQQQKIIANKYDR